MEIIKREMKIKKDIPENIGRMQMSYNSDGHLVLRFFDDSNPNEDTLIVFSFYETRNLIFFLSKLKLTE